MLVRINNTKVQSKVLSLRLTAAAVVEDGVTVLVEVVVLGVGVVVEVDVVLLVVVVVVVVEVAQCTSKATTHVEKQKTKIIRRSVKHLAH